MDQENNSVEIQMGYKPLNKIWAKLEILLGLLCVWASIHPMLLPEMVYISAGLFVLGGYLAMAGSRSHLYQSANKQTAFLLQKILDRK